MSSRSARWVGDTTEFVIGESGKLYLAAMLDRFSRFVVGWAVSAVNDRQRTLKALGMALTRRGPSTGLLPGVAGLRRGFVGYADVGRHTPIRLSTD